MKTSSQRSPSCFLFGYGGSNNTGADVRIVTIIDDIRESFGAETRITVGTFDPDKTARSLPPEAGVEIARIPFVYPVSVFRLVARHDITFLVEGSTFKENWGSALLYAFLWAAWCARLMGRRCVAYAVDVGKLSRLNRALTAMTCRGIDLLITRTEFARARLVALGVGDRVIATTDPAFRYLPEETGREDQAPGARPTIGIAPIEFYQWPVRVKLAGRKDECYHWPYYYTWDADRRRRSDRMAKIYRSLIAHGIHDHSADVALLAMEELDEAFCRKIIDGLDESLRRRIRLVSARDVPPSRMVPFLRGLDYLVTSRYHAAVLSLRGAVPQMAIAHDERLESLYREMELEGDLLLDHQDEHLGDRVLRTFDALVAQRGQIAAVLRDHHDHDYLPRCRRNRIELRAWAEREGLITLDPATTRAITPAVS